MQVQVYCECIHNPCSRSVEVSQDVKNRLKNEGLILIVNGCPHGPGAESELVESCDGYKLYKPKFLITRQDFDPID